MNPIASSQPKRPTREECERGDDAQHREADERSRRDPGASSAMTSCDERLHSPAGEQQTGMPMSSQR